MERDSFRLILTDGRLAMATVRRNWISTLWRTLLFVIGAGFLVHGFVSATAFFHVNTSHPWTQWYGISREYLRSAASVRDWCLAILLVSAAFLPRVWPKLKKPSRKQALEASILILILLAGFGWRFVDLTHTPPDVHGDEALCGNEAKELAGTSQWRLFEFGYHSKPNFTYYLTGVFLKVFGANLFGLRMASVIPGVLILLLIYLTGRLFWGSWAGLVAAALAVPWHPFVHYSRVGLNNIQSTLFISASCYFLFLGITRRKSGPMLLAGLMGALGMQTYQAAYIWPFVLIGYFLHSHLRNPWFSIRHGYRLGVFVLGCVLGIGLFAYANKGLVSGHVDEVNIFDKEQIEIHCEMYKTKSFIGILEGQFKSTWSVFNDNPGTRDTQHGTRINFIDPWLYRVLLVGLGLSVLLIFDWRWFVILWWFLLAIVLGNVLTIEIPWSPRLVMIFFPIPLLWAGVFECLRRLLFKLPENIGPWLISVPLAATLLFTYWWNTEKYFVQYCQVTHRAGFWTVAGHFLADIPKEDFVYWTGVPRIYFRYDTLLYLAPDTQGMNLINHGAQLPGEVLARRDRNAWFITYIGDKMLADVPRELWPDGERSVLKSSSDVPIFEVYYVPKDKLSGRVDDFRNNGLVATIYATRDWTGRGRKELHKVAIFSAGHAYQYLSRNFSVEWNGYLRVAFDGRYDLKLAMPHGGTGFIEIDGSRVLEEGNTFAPVDLTRGRHLIRIRYAPEIDIGRVIFTWKPPGSSEEVVPIVNLEPPDDWRNDR